MTIPAYYLPLFYACALVGFMAAMLEPTIANPPRLGWIKELP